eukprot:16119084-Heterocapsa_arctica.AAC.1
MTNNIRISISAKEQRQMDEMTEKGTGDICKLFGLQILNRACEKAAVIDEGPAEDRASDAYFEHPTW